MSELELGREMARYKAEVEAALRGEPARAARLAGLEREAGVAGTEEEFRAASYQIRDLLDAAIAEVNARREAEGRLVPKDCGKRKESTGEAAE